MTNLGKILTGAGKLVDVDDLGGGGGSQTIVDWIGLEGSGQTLVEIDGVTSRPIEFDTVFDQGDGSAISWAVGTPTDIVLAEGWYSATITIFFEDQSADAATIVWGVVIGGAGSPQLNELGSFQQSPYQPGGLQTLSAAFPAFFAPDGTILKIGGGGQRGATGDSTLNFAELLVVKLVG